MKLISHRGNINGPNLLLENTEKYIQEAIDKGYDCEIDIWKIENDLFLGHDYPLNKTSLHFLNINSHKLWIHCKNVEALIYLNSFSNMYKIYNCFYHKDDLYTLTSKGYIWGNINTPYNKNVIQVNLNKINLYEHSNDVYGFCSDYLIEKRIAIFFSGRINDYEINLNLFKKIKEELLKKNIIIDYYCSINTENNTLFDQNYYAEFLNTFNINKTSSNFEKYNYPDNLINYPNPTCPIRYNFTSMFYNTKKCIELIKSSNINYDVVMKYRTEVFFSSDFINFNFDDIKDNTIFIPNINHFLGINDQIAYGNLQSMEIYSQLYDNLPDYYNIAVKPEIMLKHHLLRKNITIVLFHFYYNLLKK